MSKKKNPLFEKEITSPIKGKMYNDSENPETPKKLKNPPFYQLYKGESFEYLKEKMAQNSAAMAVWWELVELMDNQGAVMISQQSLADFFGKTRQTINNWIKWLTEEDLIHIFKIGTANVYVINAQIISDQLVTKKQHFALFNARVIADKKEQTKKIKRKFFSVADSYIDPNQTDIFEQIKEAQNNQENEREEE
jgi:hypothetical protein